jgi:hypothetical protein
MTTFRQIRRGISRRLRRGNHFVTGEDIGESSYHHTNSDIKYFGVYFIGMLTVFKVKCKNMPGSSETTGTVETQILYEDSKDTKQLDDLGANRNYDLQNVNTPKEIIKVFCSIQKYFKIQQEIKYPPVKRRDALAGVQATIDRLARLHTTFQCRHHQRKSVRKQHHLMLRTIRTDIRRHQLTLKKLQKAISKIICDVLFRSFGALCMGKHMGRFRQLNEEKSHFAFDVQFNAVKAGIGIDVYNDKGNFIVAVVPFLLNENGVAHRIHEIPFCAPEKRFNIDPKSVTSIKDIFDIIQRIQIHFIGEHSFTYDSTQFVAEIAVGILLDEISDLSSKAFY